ncbi:MAG: hypothetical protein LBG20_03165 [Holosporaceae bacterium]|jgi:hypothetical protein|nr:hypothetical protein [Holosporaceae bacterium]
MNVSVDKEQGRFFSLEDVVSYVNIEITNVNDNRPPLRIVMKRIAIGLIILALAGALVFL